MENDANPLNRPGKRNLFCPHYRDCLDEVVKNRWLFWSCTECANRAKVEFFSDGVLTRGDTFGDYSLPKRFVQV